MQKVSDAFLRAITSNSVYGTWHGAMTTVKGREYEFGNDDIIQDNSKYTHEICTNDKLEIGTAYAGELDIGLYFPDIDRYTLYGATIELYFTLALNSGGTEDIKIGEFTVETTERTVDGIVLTAYDAMKKFEAPVATKSKHTPYIWLLNSCKSCGVQLGSTQADIVKMPNGTVACEAVNGTETLATYKDIIEYIAAYLGGVATIKSDGRLYIIQYGTKAVRTISDDWRYSLTLSDYETHYGALKLDLIKQEKGSDATSKTVTADTDGLTYSFGKNPFMQFDSDGARETCLTNIMNVFNDIYYTPFEASIPIDPSLEVGDVVDFSNGQAVKGKMSVIMSIEMTLSGATTIKCLGANPKLPDARKSDNDPDNGKISDIENTMEDIKGGLDTVLYDYNTDEFTIDQDENVFASISFELSNDSDIEGHLLLTYYASADTHLYIRMYDKESEELIAPVEFDIKQGFGTTGVPHAYLHRSKGKHFFTVTAQVLKGTLTVAVRDMLYTISGAYIINRLMGLDVDIDDLSVFQPEGSDKPTELWVSYRDNDGNVSVRKRPWDLSGEFEGKYTFEPAIDTAIEFDGKWVRRESDKTHTLYTNATPWVFWIRQLTEKYTETDKDGKEQKKYRKLNYGPLMAQLGDNAETLFRLDDDVFSVNACRGFKSETDDTQDQGLVVVYVKTDHTVWYRQWRYFSENQETHWDTAAQVDASINDALSASVCRLNDYRLAITIQRKDAFPVTYITDRTYVTQAVEPEELDMSADSGLVPLLYAPKNTDTTLKEVSHDMTDNVFTFTYNYEIDLMDDSDISDYCTMTDIDKSKIKSIKLNKNVITVEVDKSVVIRKPTFTLDPKGSWYFWLKIGDYGYEICSNSVTTSMSFIHKVTATAPAETINLKPTLGKVDMHYQHEGDLRNNPIETLKLSPTLTADIKYVHKGEKSNKVEETLKLSPTIKADIGYYDKNNLPI